ncbi:LamG-like jellyroll fold domain-containing protein [Winogradskyella maritima]|uniref:LamG-like jellyroll fold domain-containing protein n=1 Tax=Winogradskyella maritima TaxID=1517766 RepID=A0ABV8AGL6_9FLAO
MDNNATLTSNIVIDASAVNMNVPGNYNVTYNVADAAGNNAVQVTRVVTVQDTTVPAISLTGANPQILEACGTYTELGATATDCVDNNATLTSNIVIDASAVNMNVPGNYNVTYNVADAAGNNAVQLIRVVNIVDTTAPAPNITNLPPITVQCSTTLTAPTASDCVGTITATTTNPTSYNNQGTYTVTWIYDDGNGNTSSQNQTVIVDDTTNPTASNCPPNFSADTDLNQCNYTFNPVEPTFNDNCSIASVIWVMAGATTGSGTNIIGTTDFNIGTTTITYTATDIGGNSVQCTYTITVNDTQAPSITCPGNITADTSDDSTGNCTANIAIATPAFSDNCTGATIAWTITGATTLSGSGPVGTRPFNIGVSTINYTVTDAVGLNATCSQTVTVSDDENPSITCPGNQNVNYDAIGCQFTLADYTNLASSSDNCDTNITITQSPAPGTILSGSITVTLTATDDNNNQSSCMFDVIPSDVTDPIAVCQDIIVQLGAGGTVNILASDLNNGSSDACGVATFTASRTNFTCADVGTPQSVEFTVFDNAGNSDSCFATVTVEDNVAPTMQCNNFVVVIDPITRVATIQPSDVDNGSNDACGAVTLTLSQDTFPEDPNGLVYTQNVTLFGEDPNGNIASCIAVVTVEPPTNEFAVVTGVIVYSDPNDPNNPDPVPPSALIEATACPGGITEPRDVAFDLSQVSPYVLDPNNILGWEYSQDNGETWSNVPNFASSVGSTTYTFIGLTQDTFVRVRISDVVDGQTIIRTSAEAYVRFLPPDEPPVLTSDPRFDICLGESVLLTAESFFDQPNGQFGTGGEFNYAQPDGWRVDKIDNFFPAAGNNSVEGTWKETNSNDNANTTFSGINYDTEDNTKFAMAHEEFMTQDSTTLETPVFSTIGMTSAEAIMSFYTNYYFCNGAYGKIWLSFDSGNTYTVELTTMEGDDMDSRVGPASKTLGVQAYKGNGNGNGACNGGQYPVADPYRYTRLDLGAYTGRSGLRVMFEFHRGSGGCTDTFPKHSSNNCSQTQTFDIESGWAIDDVGFAFAQVDDELEWTDEEGNVIAIGTEATVQPVTPGIRNYSVTNLVNGCRAPGDDGTNDQSLVYTSLAYAGQDYIPLASQCGENLVQLNAYDNTKTSRANFTKGAHEMGLYIVPVDDASDYTPTGVTGEWSIVGGTPTSCGNLAVLSSTTDPDATFNASPGTYTLRWTLQDGSGCFDDVTVTITDCPTVDFDGTNDYVDFKNNYNLNSAFSIETWVKPESVNGTKTIMSRKDAGDNTRGYALSIVNGQVRFNWYGTSSGSVTTGTRTVGIDRWYHLAVTFNGTEYNLYVDGILLGTSNGVAPATTPANISALLGAMDQAPPNNTPVDYFHGWMDEVRIWNRALDVQHIRQMMNQEINASGADVVGTVIPTKIYGPDTDADRNEDDPLLWANLDGYYRMNVVCGDLSPYKGVSGRLINIQTSLQETAPLPYTTRANSTWDTDNTWTNFNVWDVPNSLGIDGATRIDWNIVRTNHNVSLNTRSVTVLGLVVQSNELTITGTGAQDETNTGNSIWVTDYLRLDGDMDLVGESQLVQKRYSTRQANESILDTASGGALERDQQGTTNLFNYNYWSSPVSTINTSANNTAFATSSVLMDGTNSATPVNLNWTAGYNATGSTNPVTLSSNWLFVYENYEADNYASWRYIGNNSTLLPGYGYTMKGSGVGVGGEGGIITGGSQLNNLQNYVFRGKPNNGTIGLAGVNAIPLNSYYQALVGNPYPSAIDSEEFIKDNIPALNPDNSPSSANSNTAGTMDGSLYFWEHYESNQTHILSEYQGAYAVLNLLGGVNTYNPTLISGAGTSTKTPGRYIPVGQGFFVASTIATNGYIQFENDQREFVREATGTSVFLRNGKPNPEETEVSNLRNPTVNQDISRIRINFTSHVDGRIRPLLLGFTPNNEASDGIDYGYDAYNQYFQNNDAFWLIQDNVFVIQGVGEFDENKKYPLGIFLSENSDVELSLIDLENFDSSMDVFVYDALLGTYTNLQDSNFELNLAPDYYADRFFITFKESATLSTDDIILNDQLFINYLSDNEEIYINTGSKDQNLEELQLVNILGQVVQTWDTNMENYYTDAYRIPAKDFSAGAYVVKALINGTWKTKKVIIKN